MTREMEREAPKKKIEPFASNCNYRLAMPPCTALHRGSAAHVPAHAACVLAATPGALLTLARYLLTLARYLLHIDGNVASSRLASEFHVGSTVFKQDS
jgi:hypothetical protein